MRNSVCSGLPPRRLHLARTYCQVGLQQVSQSVSQSGSRQKLLDAAAAAKPSDNAKISATAAATAAKKTEKWMDE